MKLNRLTKKQLEAKLDKIKDYYADIGNYNKWMLKLAIQKELEKRK